MQPLNKKILKLEEKIIEAKRLYYSGEATMSDDEYDWWEEKLKKLAPDSRVLKTVGYVVTDLDLFKKDNN
jgi:NAD-dependent DNA ligase